MLEHVDITGAVDMHAHCRPSLYERRVDGYELASLAAAAGMDAVVMKSHYLPTVYGVPYIEQLLDRDGVSDFTVLGSVVLNYCNGGYNPNMVRTALDMGAAVVWHPTQDSRRHGEVLGLGDYQMHDRTDEAEGPTGYEGKDGIYALDGDGELRPDVRTCLEMIAERDAVLAMGHLYFREARALAEYANELGHDKVVIDHPRFPATDFSIEQQRELAALGATLAFPAAAVMPGPTPGRPWLSVVELVDNIEALGVEHCMVTSDLGQPGRPDAPDGLRMLGEQLIDAGLDHGAVREMIDERPSRLLGLE